MADDDFTGRVVARVVNKGSKSEHHAAFLETEAGALRLKRAAGPPFHDPVLVRLAGHHIRGRGRLQNGKLLLSAWRKIAKP